MGVDGLKRVVAAKKAGKKLRPLVSPHVFARVRPPAESGGHAMEQEGRGPVSMRLSRVESGPPGAVVISDGHGEQVYDFPKRVFDLDATQEEVYVEAVRPLVDQFTDFPGGHNCLFFAYGQTGTGKTHTILGPEHTWADMHHKERGIMPRIIEDTIRVMSGLEAESGGNHVWTLQASAIQFYMMGCSDLLNDNQPIIIDNGSFGTCVAEYEPIGVRSITVTCLEDLLEVYDLVFKNRNTASTYMNTSKGKGAHSGSSRSHASIILTLKQVDRVSGLHQTTTFKVVDLAGAERPNSNRDGHASMIEAVIAYMQGKEMTAHQGVLINYELHMFRSQVVSATDLHKRGIDMNPPKQLGTPASEFLSASFTGTARLGMVVCLSPAPANGWETWFACTYGRDLAALRVRGKSVPTTPFAEALRDARIRRKNAARALAETPPKGSPKSKYYARRVCEDITWENELGIMEKLGRAAHIEAA